MEGFEKPTGVTLIRLPEGMRHPFGEVSGHATDPFTGKELVMVLWIGASKPLPYDPDELTYIDRPENR